MGFGREIEFGRKMHVTNPYFEESRQARKQRNLGYLKACDSSRHNILCTQPRRNAPFGIKTRRSYTIWVIRLSRISLLKVQHLCKLRLLHEFLIRRFLETPRRYIVNTASTWSWALAGLSLLPVSCSSFQPDSHHIELNEKIIVCKKHSLQ